MVTAERTVILWFWWQVSAIGNQCPNSQISLDRICLISDPLPGEGQSLIIQKKTEKPLKEQICKWPTHGLSLQVQYELFAMWSKIISPWAVTVLVKSSSVSRESLTGNLPTSVYSANNKNQMGRAPWPSFSQQFNWRCRTWNGGREKRRGKWEFFHSAWQQLNERASTTTPFEVVLMLRQQTHRNTCEQAGSDTSWKCNYSEDQGELVRQCLLSSPCQYPLSIAAGSGDSLTSLFPLAWSQLLKRCDYPSPLALLFFEEEFWHHLSLHGLCFPPVQWPL